MFRFREQKMLKKRKSMRKEAERFCSRRLLLFLFLRQDEGGYELLFSCDHICPKFPSFHPGGELFTLIDYMGACMCRFLAILVLKRVHAFLNKNH